MDKLMVITLFSSNYAKDLFINNLNEKYKILQSKMPIQKNLKQKILKSIIKYS
jgi:uncharacterized membrane protein YqhA